MDADRHLDELATIFEQALERPVEERAAFLDEACRDDPTLRAELDSLLVNYEEAPAFFERLGDVVPALPGGHPASASTADPSGLIGTTVGRYQILEKLGAGGMGVVYKAHDTRLKRPVALKFLPAHLGQNVSARQRFEHEAQAASALDHANICTIYEIGEAADGQVFIAMGYYEGETLRQKIQRGPMPLEETLDYVVQIARGLEKAHARGIVHRDVKPANVMVTSDSVVKILDFGLAKMEELLLTRTGTTLGTVAYMSPEQTRGEKVDHRTDIWALGVLFYEMLAGERPFRGDYQQAIIYSVLNEEPASIKTLNPELPEALEHLVAMCLEKDQALRYATMADFLADLEVFVQGDGSSSRTALRAPHRRHRKAHRWLLAAGGLLAVLVLLLAIPSVRNAVFSGQHGAGNAEEMGLAVIPFVNNLEDTPENQALVDGLMYSLIGVIARLEAMEGGLWVVPANEVIGRGVETASDARKVFGVDRVVAGNVRRVGETTTLNLELIDPAGKTQLLATGTINEPLTPTFADTALVVLTNLLGVVLDAQSQQAIHREGPADSDAYAFYIQGMGYLQRYDKPGNLDYAAQSFNEALKEDPQYALAYAGLCETYLEQYRIDSDTLTVGRALNSCDQATQLDDQLARVHVAQGKIYYYTGEYPKAEAELRRALDIERKYADAYYWLGRVYERNDEFAQAIDAYRQAIALKTNYWLYYHDLGIAYFLADSLEQAGLQFEKEIRLVPDNHLAYNALGVVRRNRGKIEEAKDLFQRSLDTQPSTFAYNNLGQLHFRDHEYTQAARMFEQARDLQENAISAWKWLGYAYYWADGERGRARSAWQQVLELAELQYAVNDKDYVVLNDMAEVNILLGDHEKGRFYLDRLRLHMRPKDFITKFSIARMYELLGDRELALQYLEEALVGGFDPVIPDRDPWLEDLRTTSAYRDLRHRFLEVSTKPAV